MYNFEYQNPTKIVFGKGEISKLKTLIAKGTKVMVTYGGGSIKTNGVYSQVMEALSHCNVVEFSGIEANPTYETCMKAIELGKKEHVEFVLAVGGGSVIDGSKFIIAGIKYVGNPWDFIEKKAIISEAVKLGTVLTLPATGSEMNCGFVLSRKETGEKLSIGHPLLFPQFSILDPETTYSLPIKQVRNGIVDAFIHTTEQYLTFPANAQIQDRFSESIISTLVEDGPKVLNNLENYELRANLMWSATMALNGLIGVGVPQDWATHLIGHELTAAYGLDHGQTLAIVLPSLLHYKKSEKLEKLAQYGRRVWALSGSDALVADCSIAKTREFFESLGVKTHLSDYGITPENFDHIIKTMDSHGEFYPKFIGEKGNISREDIKNILEMCR